MPDEKKPPFPTVHGVEPRIATPKSVERPELPPTVPTMSAAPPWAISMMADFNKGIAELRDSHSGLANEFVTLGQKFMSLSGDVTKLQRTTGKHAAVILPSDGPQKTYSGEVKRISQSDFKQNEAISGLSENQVALHDTVQALAKKVDATEKKADEAVQGVARVEQTQQQQNKTLQDQNGSLATIQHNVSGFMARNPALAIALVSFVTALLTWGTSYLKAKGLQ